MDFVIGDINGVLTWRLPSALGKRAAVPCQPLPASSAPASFPDSAAGSSVTPASGSVLPNV